MDPASRIDIFIVAPRVALAQARLLHRALSKRGLGVFLAEESLLPGDAWDSVVPRALNRALITVVLMASAVDTRWYRRENVARTIAWAGRLRRVVPVALDDKVEPDYGLQRLSSLSLPDLGKDHLVEALAQVVERSRWCYLPVSVDADALRAGAPVWRDRFTRDAVERWHLDLMKTPCDARALQSTTRAWLAENTPADEAGELAITLCAPAAFAAWLGWMLREKRNTSLFGWAGQAERVLELPLEPPLARATGWFETDAGPIGEVAQVRVLIGRAGAEGDTQPTDPSEIHLRGQFPQGVDELGALLSDLLHHLYRHHRGGAARQILVLDTDAVVAFALGRALPDLDITLRGPTPSPMEFDLREVRSTNPFKRLQAYEPEDANRFFAREGEAEAVVRALRGHRRWLLLGESGVGKSSLVRAGVIPALRAEGFVEITVPQPGVTETLKGWLARSEPGVIVVDQLEQAFEPGFDPLVRAALLDRLIPEAWDTTPMIRWLFVIRADQLFQIFPHTRFQRELIINAQRLMRLSGAAARVVLKRTFALARGLEVTDSLIGRVVDDLLEASGGEADAAPYPPYIQLIGYELVERARQRGVSALTVDDYSALGAADEVVSRYFRTVLAALPAVERELARALLARLSPSGRRERLSEQALAEGAWHVDAAREVLHVLVESRIVVFDEQQRDFELVHDVLAREIHSHLRGAEVRFSFRELLSLSSRPPPAPAPGLMRNLLLSSVSQGFPTEPWERLYHDVHAVVRDYRTLLDRVGPVQAERILLRLAEFGETHELDTEAVLGAERIAALVLGDDRTLRQPALRLLADRGLPPTMMDVALAAFAESYDALHNELWIEAFGRSPHAPYLDLVDLTDANELRRIGEDGLRLYVVGLLHPELPWHTHRAMVEQRIKQLFAQRESGEALRALGALVHFEDAHWVPYVITLIDHLLVTQHPPSIRVRDALFVYLANVAPDALFEPLVRFLRTLRNEDEQRDEQLASYLAHGLRTPEALAITMALHRDRPILRGLIESAIQRTELTLINFDTFVDLVGAHFGLEPDPRLCDWVRLRVPAEVDALAACVDGWGGGSDIPKLLRTLPLGILTGVAQHMHSDINRAAEQVAERTWRLYRIGRTLLNRRLIEAAGTAAADVARSLRATSPWSVDFDWEPHADSVLESTMEIHSLIRDLDGAIEQLVERLDGSARTEITRALVRDGSAWDHRLMHIAHGTTLDGWRPDRHYPPARLARALDEGVAALVDALTAKCRLYAAQEEHVQLERLAAHALFPYTLARLPDGYAKVRRFLDRQVAVIGYGADSRPILIEALVFQDPAQARQDLLQRFSTNPEAIDSVLLVEGERHLLRAGCPGLLSGLPSIPLHSDSEDELLSRMYNSRGSLPVDVLRRLLRASNPEKLKLGLAIAHDMADPSVQPDLIALLSHRLALVRQRAKEALAAIVARRCAPDPDRSGRA